MNISSEPNVIVGDFGRKSVRQELQEWQPYHRLNWWGVGFLAILAGSGYVVYFAVSHLLKPAMHWIGF